MKQAGVWEPEERDILGCEELSIGDWPAGTRSISRKGSCSGLASYSFCQLLPSHPILYPNVLFSWPWGLLFFSAPTHIQVHLPVLCRALDLPASAWEKEVENG